jgi:hypothetical protein
MDTARPAHEWRATADEIWALLQKSARHQEEADQRQKEIDREQKEINRQLSKLGSRFGEMIECMVMPNLITKFRELGFEFTKAGPDVKITDRKNGISLEVDAFLENGDRAMAVEIKSKPNTGDINDHVERMEKLRRYADLRNDRRKYLGAIAGVVFNDNEKAYTLKQGFYVIEPSGDTFNIIEPSGDSRPREW